MIFARSTFSIVSTFINPYLKNIYFIEDLVNKDNYYDLISIAKQDCPKEINYHNYKFTEKYIIPGEWKNDTKDIENMLNFSIKNILNDFNN